MKGKGTSADSKNPQSQLSMRYIAAAMSDLAPKLLHRYRKSARFAQGGTFRTIGCSLVPLDFEDDMSLVKLMGFMCRVMGTRQSFSTTDIHKRDKSSRTTRRAVSEMKLFSREYYAYKLDSMEDEDIFSSACTSRLHEHFKLCKATQSLDRARSRNKHIQLRYIRNRIQDLFQDVVKFSAAHQEYMNQVRNRNSSNENVDSSKLDEDGEFYVATGGSEPYVVECKEGLDIADVEHCCGDYVTNFNRILRVYQWLYRCKRSNN